MPKIGGANIVSKQSKLLKIKTKNYFAKFPKRQECGA
jgi:hypothetical protein